MSPEQDAENVALAVALDLLADITMDLLPLLLHIRGEKTLAFQRFVRDSGLEPGEVDELLDLAQVQAAIVEAIEESRALAEPFDVDEVTG